MEETLHPLHPMSQEKIMKTGVQNLFVALALLALSTLNSQFSNCFAQGSLTPPGTPAPTMKSLDQIEARTPITNTASQIGRAHV